MIRQPGCFFCTNIYVEIYSMCVFLESNEVVLHFYSWKLQSNAVEFIVCSRVQTTTTYRLQLKCSNDWHQNRNFHRIIQNVNCLSNKRMRNENIFDSRNILHINMMLIFIIHLNPSVVFTFQYFCFCCHFALYVCLFIYLFVRSSIIF